MKSVLSCCKWFGTSFIAIFLSVRLFAQGTEFLGEDETPPALPQIPNQQPVPAAPAEEAPPTLPQATPALPQISQWIDLIFLMDVSGSMERTLPDSRGLNKLDAAKTILIGMIPSLRETIRFQLWTFSSRIDKLKNSPAVKPPPLSPIFEPIGKPDSIARKHLTAEIQKIQPPGDFALRTNLYHAVNDTIFYFQSALYQAPQNQTPIKTIVLLSDGQDDNLSPITLGIVMSTKIKFPDVDIRAIGYTISKDDEFFQVLCQIASKNQCVTANNWAELKKMIQLFIN